MDSIQKGFTEEEEGVSTTKYQEFKLKEFALLRILSAYAYAAQPGTTLAFDIIVERNPNDIPQ